MGVKRCWVEISGADRSELEHWLRAQSIPQALATRARVVLGSAAGECPRSGSAAWGNPDHGLSVAAALSERGTRWAAHQAAYGPPAADYLGQGAGGNQRDAAQAQGGDPLERAALGQAGRAVAGHSPSHLAEVWAPAAPGRNLQVQLRPAVRRQAGRYRRALSGPAGARAGAVRGNRLGSVGPPLAHRAESCDSSFLRRRRSAF